MFPNFQNTFTRRPILALFFLLLLFFQLIYSFAVPSVGDNGNWLPITDYLPKFSAEGHDNFLLKTFYPLISSKYRLNSDVGEYLIVARDFSREYLEGHQYLNRPLYSFLVLLSSRLVSPFISISYGVFFGLAIIINFIFVYGAVLLFFVLLKKIFSFKIAFLSSILLIFSPYVHTHLTQPGAEMLTTFGLTLSLYLLYQYVRKPTLVKLTGFSLLAGVFMLGKMFFATPLFILIAAVCYKRFREGIIFATYYSIPVILWYIWVTRIWDIPYYVNEIQQWRMGIWIFGILAMPVQQAIKILVDALPSFISAVFHSFIFIPVVFAIIGVEKLSDQNKKRIIYALIFSVFAFTFLINLHLYRHTFLLFPAVYPAAILGIEWASGRLAGRNNVLKPVFEIATVALIIFISSINIYKFYYYI